MPSFDQLTLQTERLLMRPFKLDDAADLLSIFSDPLITKYGITLPWTELETAQKRIQRDLKEMLVGDSLCLAIVRLSDNQLLGDCSLFHFSEQCRRAEIGYVLKHAAWGQGYMQEALLALIQYGFSELRLNRIEADIDPMNLASARCLERLGFKLEDMLRERWIVAGVVSDSAMYGLLASDWAARS